MTTIPQYEADIYSDEAILDPYPHYAAMRNLGALLYLPAHDIYAIPRYAEVKAALLDHRHFLSGKGVAGFEWPEVFRVANTLAADEPVHSRFRSIIGAPLAPPSLERLSADIELAADDLIARLIERGSFDGMTDLAQFIPLSIVSSLVGLPEHGRQRMLEWAAASFDLLGVGNKRAAGAAQVIGEMIAYVQNECRPDTVRPEGWAAQIWQAVEQGKITPAEAGTLHIDIVAPALDTTIFATGHLLYQLASNPGEWNKLKDDPRLIPAAIDEAVRLDSPIRAFGRVVEGDQTIDGAAIPSGSRVLMMYASANRDERRWEDPERYWIERPGLSGHLGFGQGRHTCAGMHLAKLEMRSLLKSLLKRARHIKVGTPNFQMNNVLRGFASLPTRLIPA